MSYDRQVDFSKYKTFAQAPPPKRGANLVGYTTIVGQEIQEEIARQLQAKGFSPASPTSADLIVSIAVSGQQRADVQSDGLGWYGGYGDTYTVRYVEGTLVIDIFERKGNRLVFHGWDQKQIFSGRADSSVATQAVKEILKKFPPGKDG